MMYLENDIPGYQDLYLGFIKIDRSGAEFSRADRRS